MEVLRSETGDSETTPQNAPLGLCTLRAHEEPPSDSSRPVEEASAAAGGEGDQEHQLEDPDHGYLPLWEQVASVAAAPTGSIALSDEPLVEGEDRDPRSYRVSVSKERREVVVDVVGDPSIAITGGRLAMVLADNAVLHDVLTDAALGENLSNLADGHLHVLRLARNVAALKNEDAAPQNDRDRLASWSRSVSWLMDDVRPAGADEEAFDDEAAAVNY